MMVNFNVDAICRLCLESGVLRPISFTIKTTDTTKVSCSEMIDSLISIPIRSDYVLPNKICTKCLSKLKAAYVFKKQCEQSYKIFMEDRGINVETITESGQENEDDMIIENMPLKCEIIEENTEYIFNSDQNVDDDNNDSNGDLPITFLRNEKETSENLIETKKRTWSKSKDVLDFDIDTLKLDNGNFQCNRCLKIFQHKRYIVKHLEKHFDVKNFFCELCQKFYACETNHMRNHKEPQIRQFECDMCQKKFLKKGALKAHIVIHNKNKSNICDYCGKALKTAETLYVHKKIHTDTKKFMCQFCSNTFLRKQKLMDHLQFKHSEERKFQCTTCDKKFVTKYCLKVHEDRHFGIKKFKCDCCDQAFVSGSENMISDLNEVQDINEIPLASENSLTSIDSKMDDYEHSYQQYENSDKELHNATSWKTNTSHWKRNIQRKRRSECLPYESRGNLMAAKLPRNITCSCRHKCMENFTPEDRLRICKEYWELSDYKKQKEFILFNVHTTKPKSKQKGTKSGKNRASCRTYYFQKDNESIRVCQQFFADTLCISKGPINKAFEGMGQYGHYKGSDNRGKNPVFSETALMHIKTHIGTLPDFKFNSNFSVAKLYSLYKKYADANGILPVSRMTYGKYFNRAFDYQFFNQMYSLTKHRKTHTKEKDYNCRLCEALFSRSDTRNRHEKSIHGIGIRIKDQ